MNVPRIIGEVVMTLSGLAYFYGAWTNSMLFIWIGLSGLAITAPALTLLEYAEWQNKKNNTAKTVDKEQ